MKKAIRDAWVNALRSGEYQQGRGTLRRFNTDDGVRSDSYCCLGVLCDLAERAGAVDSYESGVAPDNGRVEYGSVLEREAWFLPLSVRNWSGLDASDPPVEYEGVACSLTSLNDDIQLSFTEIADIVESQIQVTDE